MFAVDALCSLGMLLLNAQSRAYEAEEMASKQASSGAGGESFIGTCRLD